MAALATGTLAPDPRFGIGLRGSTGALYSVEWPFGFHGARLDGRVALVNMDGSVFAREGDAIEMGGGFGPGDELFNACPSGIKVTPR
jgi:hypothetical protein